MSELEDVAELRRRFPDQQAREAADKAIDVLPGDTPLVHACGVWLDTYREEAGR